MKGYDRATVVYEGITDCEAFLIACLKSQSPFDILTGQTPGYRSFDTKALGCVHTHDFVLQVEEDRCLSKQRYLYYQQIFMPGSIRFGL
jgi:hypothetical protein